MDRNLFESLGAIAAGVIGVAILAVIVSRNSNTSQVIGATGSAFSNVLSAATAPVTGKATAANVNGPSSSGFSLPTLPTLGSLSLNP